MGEAADVVRLAVERLNERDLDGFAALCSPRIRFQDVPEIPGSRLREGPDEVREWAEGVLEMGPDVRIGIWEASERGDAVLTETSTELSGSGGAQMGWRFWAVWRVRERLVAYHRQYSLREDALADFEDAG